MAAGAGAFAAADSQLAALAAARGPLRRVLAAVAGRLVATRAWERLGFARLRDYAVERAGHSARSLQDLARVDTALAGLPRIEAALVAGELTWTQVRLLCRVARDTDEARWVAVARSTTARALSREVRAVDAGALGSPTAATDEDGAPEEACETVQLRCTPAVRARWWHARQLAQRVAGQSLPAWGCIEAVTAEVLSALPLAVDPEPVVVIPAELPAAPAAEPAPTERLAADPAPLTGAAIDLNPRAPAANGCAEHAERKAFDTRAAEARGTELPVFLSSLVAGLESADAFELDARVRRALALEQRLEAEVGPLLLRIAEGRLHRIAGFASMDEYARERLGVSPRKARALLRLERAGRRAQMLRDAYRDGRLSWVQAHALVPVLAIASAHQGAWIDWACRVTVRRLQDDVEHALVLHETDPLRFEETAGLPADARGHGRENREPPGATQSERQTGARATGIDETCRIFWTAPCEVARLFRATLCTVRRHIERRTGRLPSEGEAFDAMLEHAFETWGDANTRVRAAHRVFARDGWRCSVPGCSSYRELHDHHIHFRSAGGSDAESNRTTLCAWHHLRGVHGDAGRLRVRGRAPRRLRFELGLRQGAPPLLRYTAGERLAGLTRARAFATVSEGCGGGLERSAGAWRSVHP